MKLLTGKCEKDFRQWLRPDITSDHRYSELITNCFDDFPLAMQWGVIQDFAISKSFELFIKPDRGDYICFAGISVNTFYIGTRETCTEAREEGIKHFNKLYNETK